MRIRYPQLIRVAAAAMCAGLLGAGAAGAEPPSPGGPMPPAEAPVDGPANLDGLTVRVRPDGGYLTGVTVEFDRTSRTESGEKPAAAQQFVFLFDRSVRINAERFPTCARAVLAARGPAGCPAGSQVGVGAAEIYPDRSAQVLVFNTRYANGDRGVLITIPATGGILENTLEPVSDGYRADYGVALDELLPSPLPAAQRPATTRFRVTFGATRTDHTGTHSYLESFALPGTPLKFALWSHFVTGQIIEPTAYAPRPLG
ncbi:hypothetical protein NMK54_13480 [Nocardia otitidiscaviarum]|uniref:hypothetical protein n=1 Tax=Nocardia otitidiscaviarum TaxID=1823 RepID=UPI001C8F9F60|nr:hypothetical protein [Nocardia otitidiscaviarum]MCP9621169.1 hypothetical protein [Nocardia otitidiscaviarum]